MKDEPAIPSPGSDPPVGSPPRGNRPDEGIQFVSDDSAAASLPGTELDYELLRLIGRGAYGEVWLARDKAGAYRAVKVVFRESFDHDRPYEREFDGIRKFEPVSRSYENQVQILHVGRQDKQGRFYYIMELADDQRTGQKIDPRIYEPKTLKSELKKRGRFPVEECLRIGLALAGALENLHQHGLIHRDIKPGNIIFVNGVTKLADIGLVTDRDVSVSYVGTEGYIPPEGPSSVQADIFSLGKVLYEMATGRDRMDFPELPTDLQELPDRGALLELNAIFAKACARDPKRRYRNARQVYSDLASLQRGKTMGRFVGSRGLKVAGKACALAVLLGLAGWGSYHAWKSASSGGSKLDKPATGEKKPASSSEADVLGKAINLLPLIDPQKDALAGHWQMTTNGLLTDIEFVSRLEIPYEPPEEYDFRITFTRLEASNKGKRGWGDASQLLQKDGAAFVWYMGAHGNTFFGFDLVGGKRFDANATGVKVGECLQLGRRYTSVVAVRKRSVQAFLDGKLISEWRPEMGALSEGPYSTRRDKKVIGVGACNVRTVFHSAEVREVTGQGRLTRPASSTQESSSSGPALTNAAKPPPSNVTGPSAAAPVITKLESALSSKDKTAAEDALEELEKLLPTDSRVVGWRARVAALPGLKKTEAIDLGGGVKMEFVLIPSGSFMMGCDTGSLDEKPVHKVTITRPFYLGKYEVTQEQWQTVMRSNPSYRKGPKLPVDSVRWSECLEFMKKLQERVPGRQFVLPTEAQWEYACRAGTTTLFNFGDGDPHEYAWFGGNAGDMSHPVGQKKPNAWGLYDMHGNVSEWCAGWFGPYPGGDAIDPQGAALGQNLVLRGGSWPDGDLRTLRSSHRGSRNKPSGRAHNAGFRVVLLVGGSVR